MRNHKPLRTRHKILLSILIVFLLLTGVVLFCAPYLPHAIKSSYFRGQNGPGIYDLNVSASREIQSANEQVFPRSQAQFQMNDFRSLQSYSQKLGTVAFLIARNDEILLEDYADGHSADKVSNSFSMAKTVVSLLMGIAVEEGKVRSLDDKVVQYLPEIKGKHSKEVTIRHLLQMAAGTDWKESSKGPFSDNASAYYGKKLSKQIYDTKFIDQPGKFYDYQSGNTQFLAMILQEVYGKGVAQLTQEKIWKPMQMSHQAYWSMDEEDGVEKAYCCLYATAADFLKLGHLYLYRGRYKDQVIVPEWYMDEMIESRAPRLKTSKHPNELYGLHVWMYQREDDELIYFRGILGQYIIISPKYHWVAVRLGHQRLPNYSAQELKKDNLFMEGQTKDFVEYVKFVDEIIQLSYK